MIYLSNRVVIEMSGADVLQFLQGQCTQDVNLLAEDKPQYGATLTPQGKYFADYIIHKVGDKILLDIDASRADDLIKKFNMYKLRSDVQIAKAALRVYADFVQGTPDPRSTKLMKRVLSETELPTDGEIADYKLHLLKLGVPDSADFVVDKSFIMHYRFEELQGVSFTKGCYVGQENTARMKYKGTVRKSLFTVRGKADLGEAGVVLNAVGDVALALCEIDALAGLAEQGVEISAPIY